MASLDPFPPEIIQHVVHYLTHYWRYLPGIDPNVFRSWERIRGAARYATVNTIWQDAVERETFADLSLDLARLAEAETILNGVPRRQKYVRIIRVNVVLPAWDPAVPESGSDRANSVL